MGAFSEVLKNDVPVYEVNGDLVASPCSLRDIKTPSGGTLLSEIEDLKHAYLDVDGDMINELIIDCGDILILPPGCWDVFLSAQQPPYRRWPCWTLQ